MKLSVFVVTYNQEKYIRQCLDSILMQKVDFDYEVVIGEDHGNDGTRAICEEYARNFSQVRLLTLTKNLGVAKNWRRVLSECNGEYIAMCEGDDYWTDPTKLQKQVDFLDANKSYVLSFHDATIVDEMGNIVVISKMKKNNGYCDRSQEDLIRGLEVSTQTVMFRSENLKKILKEMSKYSWFSNDTLLFSLLGRYGSGKFQSEISNSVYRMHRDAVWSAANEIKKKENAFYSYLYMGKLHPNYRRHFNEKCMSLSAAITMLSIKEKSLRYFLRFYPLSLWWAVKCMSLKQFVNINKGILYNLVCRNKL